MAWDAWGCFGDGLGWGLSSHGRSWQLQEYEDGANQLQEDTELPAMDTLLETMRDGNDEAVKVARLNRC